MTIDFNIMKENLPRDYAVIIRKRTKNHPRFKKNGGASKSYIIKVANQERESDDILNELVKLANETKTKREEIAANAKNL